MFARATMYMCQGPSTRVREPCGPIVIYKFKCQYLHFLLSDFFFNSIQDRAAYIENNALYRGGRGDQHASDSTQLPSSPFGSFGGGPSTCVLGGASTSGTAPPGSWPRTS